MSCNVISHLFFSIDSQIFLYTGLGPKIPKKLFNPTGYVCILPHFVQGIGAKKHVAYHSAAGAMNLFPQLSHLKVVVPNIILLRIIRLILDNFIVSFLHTFVADSNVFPAIKLAAAQIAA